ncbi:MAG: MATE family efflux transporter [Lachnospiraceae bacterium]|nr:MATE family efflux transporter [Lachnospiraceae bacterium]
MSKQKNAVIGEKSKKVGMDLTEGSILKCLLVFAVPIVVTNVIQQFYSMVDLMVIGQYVGATGTVAVSTGGEVSDMVTPVATAFSTAGQIYIAQLFGAKKTDKVKKGIGTLITLMMIMALVIMTCTIIFSSQILRLLNCPSEAFREAMEYMIITAIGIPFIYGYNAVCGVLRGMGESRKPLIFVLVAATVNIFLDILLVAVFKMGAAGTAIATAMSQFGSFIAAFIYMYINREQFDFELKLSYFKIDRPAAEVILKQGIPQAARSMLVRFSMLWVNSSVNSYGLVASATNSVGNKLQKFLEVFLTGVTQASGAMVGQNLGAQKAERAKKTVWYCFFSCMIISLVLTVFAWFWPREIFGIFTKDPDVLDFGVIYMHILIMHFFMSAITGSFQSMVTGSGFASMNFLIGVLDGVVCRIGFSVLFAYVMGMGVVGFFWGTAFSRTIPGLVCFLYFISGKWKERKLLTE